MNLGADLGDLPRPMPTVGHNDVAYVLACYAERASNVATIREACLSSACSLVRTTRPRNLIMMVEGLHYGHNAKVAQRCSRSDLACRHVKRWSGRHGLRLVGCQGGAPTGPRTRVARDLHHVTRTK